MSIPSDCNRGGPKVGDKALREEPASRARIASSMEETGSQRSRHP
jgi:hypothetical protein